MHAMFKPQTSNLKPQTTNLKPQTANLKPQTSNRERFFSVGTIEEKAAPPLPLLFISYHARSITKFHNYV